jgi:hypothetical protein
MEKVNGEYQGAVFRFSGGLDAGANRIITDADGAMYIGGIGAADRWGGWGWENKNYGLQKMEETNTPFFDVLGIRSLGNNSFAIDFTEPATAAAATNFVAQQWSYTPGAAYGCCRNGTQTLSVQSASLSADGKTATVQIAGLTRKNVVFLRLNGIQAKSGRPLWTDRIWYTLNEFGPGTPVPVSNEVRRKGPDGWNLRSSVSPEGRISFSWNPLLQPKRVELLTLDGKTLESSLAGRDGFWQSTTRHTRGTYFLRIRADGSHAVSKVAIP